MNDPAFDRLACVSRLLMDQRVIELRRENERLKMCIFWRDHNTVNLREVLMYSNLFAPGAPDCRCISCCISGVAGHHFGVDSVESCKFIPWIQGVAERYGMTMEVKKPESSHVSHPSLPGHVYDQDCHFVWADVTERAYCTYGARIWKAQTVSDINLKKLSRFFDELLEDSPMRYCVEHLNEK
jgi:hypothetical protein